MFNEAVLGLASVRVEGLINHPQKSYSVPVGWMAIVDGVFLGNDFIGMTALLNKVICGIQRFGPVDIVYKDNTIL